MTLEEQMKTGLLYREYGHKDPVDQEYEKIIEAQRVPYINDVRAFLYQEYRAAILVNGVDAVIDPFQQQSIPALVPDIFIKCYRITVIAYHGEVGDPPLRQRYAV